MPGNGSTLALLIDGDNASPKIVSGLLAEVAKYGVASVRRIYGDWTKPNLGGWKSCLLEHSIQPIQQFAYTTGKNATDGAMIIDAMDLLNTGRFDGFCIVSSDSDFARLAARIREQGVTVYGFGERKTPDAFRNACDKFTFLEVLEVEEPEVADTAAAPSTRVPAAKLRGDGKLTSALRKAVDTASDDDGWANLGAVGQLMRKQQPDFDSRNWGYAKLSDLVKAIGLFTIETKPGGMRLQLKKKKQPA